jgi:hypothetical protein
MVDLIHYIAPNVDCWRFQKYIGIDGIVKFPQRKTFYKKSKSSDISEQYFNEVPKYYLRKLWQHLKGDYLLFSYPVPNNLSDKSNL